ncbi:hypothetical protein F511_41762 [Dorcoceras hygrometricum]|uniref:Uncharacterized protein n=1 Tax=Dorcoceras hygrometricum TaxID=472368 RepID=A0A2Z7B3W8_9LAMI|nr:hypothetical protein F511_41762 [Dorcoceras hygrometricum]
MASSFITYALQVDFESVLKISDHEGMVNMFKSLEASGLRGFLGCPSVFYEKELEYFFDTALVQDGDITGAVSGKFFAISESRFAEVFRLPTEGLVYLCDVPKDLVYDARSILSKYGSPLSTYSKKRMMEEMVDKTLKKAKGFAPKNCVLLKSDPVIMMGEAVPFPSLKILSIKTVNTYVFMNETIDAHGKSNEPGMAKVKRPTVVGDEAAITKNKRTTKSKASSSKASMDMVSVAQDAVSLQIIEPTPVATAEQPPVPKRKSKKRRLVLSKGSDVEDVEEMAAIENVENVEKPIIVDVTVGEIVVEPTEEERPTSVQVRTITDDVDVIIEQVIAETSQLATDEGDQFFDGTNVEEIVLGDTSVDKADDFQQWFDRSYEDFVSRDAEQLIVSTSELDKGTGTAETVAGEQQVPMFVEKETVAESEGSKDFVVAKVFEKSVGSNQIDEELMTLDDLLMQISDDMMLPSITAAEITKIKSDLPVNSPKYMIKTVRGVNFCRDIVVHSSAVDVLEKIPNNFCSVFQQGIDTNSFVGYFSDSGVQPVLQSVPDIELLSSDGSTVYRSPSSQSDAIFDQDDLMDFHANSDSDEQTSDHQFDLPVSTTNVESTPAVAQFSLPATDIKESFAQLRAFIEYIRYEQIRHKEDTDRLRDVLLMHIRDLEKKSTERFDQLDRAYRTLLTNSCKDSQDLRAVLSLDLSTSQKKLSTQVAAATLDNVDVRKEVKELNAKVTSLDEQVAATRNDFITACKMVSMKNPLAAILDSNRFTGLNYQDWLRNLNLVLASEKLLYTIEKCPSEETPADIIPEELITLNQ